jgi:TonB family protein
MPWTTNGTQSILIFPSFIQIIFRCRDALIDFYEMKISRILLRLATAALLMSGFAPRNAYPTDDAPIQEKQNSPATSTIVPLPAGILSNIDSVTAIISDAIRANHYANVLVLGAEGPGTQYSQLGMSIGDAFSASLEKRAEGFQVITRDASRAFLESVMATPNSVISGELNEAICLGTRSQAYVLVKFEKIEQGKAVITAYLLKSTLPTPGAVDIKQNKSQTGWRFETDLDQSMVEAGESSVNTKTGKILNGITLPQCVNCPTPEYTESASRNRFQGSLLLIVTVETNGKPGQIEVLKGAPYGMDKASVNTVKTWTFKPAKDQNGAAVVRRILVTVTLNLY